MPNEIKITPIFNYTSGLLKLSFSPGQKTYSQTTQQAHGQIVSVGSGAEEDMPAGDVATNGWLLIYNLDTVNFVKYGPKTAGVMAEFGRLRTGEFAILRLAAGVTNRWIADTAAVKVQMIFLND